MDRSTANSASDRPMVEIHQSHMYLLRNVYELLDVQRGKKNEVFAQASVKCRWYRHCLYSRHRWRIVTVIDFMDDGSQWPSFLFELLVFTSCLCVVRCTKSLCWKTAPLSLFSVPLWVIIKQIAIVTFDGVIGAADSWCLPRRVHVTNDVRSVTWPRLTVSRPTCQHHIPSSHSAARSTDTAQIRHWHFTQFSRPSDRNFNY